MQEAAIFKLDKQQQDEVSLEQVCWTLTPSNKIIEQHPVTLLFLPGSVGIFKQLCTATLTFT